MHICTSAHLHICTSSHLHICTSAIPHLPPSSLPPTFATVHNQNTVTDIRELIASYLFQKKSCPLPGLGNLSIFNTGAITDFTNKKIYPSKTVIRLDTQEGEPAPLLAFIAKKNGITLSEASTELYRFSGQVKMEIEKDAVSKLPGIGDLFIDGNGALTILPEELPKEFLPSVTAERVVHPEAEHSILVGDKESTNTEMTEYYNESPIARDRWWIWAIILGVIGIVVILIYLNDTGFSSSFGNAIKS